MFSGVLCALSTMVNLEIPHVNVMSKVDLLNKDAKRELERYLEPEVKDILEEELVTSRMGSKFEKLNHSIASMVNISHQALL